ncbi:recombinase family protein [Tessaracoccus coleopterorum]|uniref:recombinase family protein n=1 Tax=Tessaracoccus coleopterorum TaxID=2714950 RepID=UPI0022B24249|nr:recombinase family protein [Tessaracoccus coleopterorum]
MHVTRRCFGYEPDGVTIRDVEAQAIREGVESILNEGSLYGIAKRWNEAGLLPPQGRHRSQEELAAHAEAVEDALAKNEEPPPLPSLRPSRWTGERVRAHFRSRRIAGIVTYKGEEVRDPETGEPVPATWPAIITREQWRAVQRVLETNSQKRRFPSGERQLLSGLARCAECGSPMMSGGQRNGRRRIRCGLKGQHVYRESGPIDDYVERVMIARLSRPETRRQLTIATAQPSMWPESRRSCANSTPARSRWPRLTRATRSRCPNCWPSTGSPASSARSWSHSSRCPPRRRRARSLRPTTSVPRGMASPKTPSVP